MEKAQLKTRLLELMEKHEVDHIDVMYSGSGDEGGIDDVQLIAMTPTGASPVADVTLDEPIVVGTTTRFVHNETTCNIDAIEVPNAIASLGNLARELGEIILDEDGADFNNDGCSGIITIECKDKRVTNAMNSYYTASNDEVFAH